jgi:hypothetical protein
MEQKMSVFSAKKVEKSQEQLQIKAAILASYSQVGSAQIGVEDSHEECGFRIWGSQYENEQ